MMVAALLVRVRPVGVREGVVGFDKHTVCIDLLCFHLFVLLLLTGIILKHLNLSEVGHAFFAFLTFQKPIRSHTCKL